MNVVVYVIGGLVTIILGLVAWYARSVEKSCAALKSDMAALKNELCHDNESLQRKVEMDEERHIRWRHDVWHPNNADVQKRLATAEEQLRQLEKRVNGKH